MCADFRLDPRLLMQQRDPVESFARGFGLVQNLQGKQLQNIEGQRRMEQAQREQQALQQYKESGDPIAFRGTNPELELKIKDHLAKQPYEKLDRYGKAIDYWNRNRGQMIGNPESYQGVYKGLKEIDPDIVSGMVSPEQFKGMTLEQQKQHLYQNDIIAAGLKRGLTPYQEGMLKLKGMEIGAKVSKYGVDALKGISSIGEKPSFANFVKDPEISKLSYPEQVAAFNSAVSEGKAEGKATGTPTKIKPLTDAEMRQLENLSRREKSGRLTPTSKETLDYLKKRQSEILGRTIPPQTGEQTFSAMPPAANHKGKQLTSPDGKQFISDGTNWTEQ